MDKSAEQRHMARIFRQAAGVFLSPTKDRGETTWTLTPCALGAVENTSWMFSRGAKFEEELGAPSEVAFYEFKPGIHRQGARFLWLHFVAEGLERGLIDL